MLLHFNPIAAFQSYTAAETGDRIDDQPQPFHAWLASFLLYALQVMAHSSGLSNNSCWIWWTVLLCGAVWMISGSV